MMALTIDTCLGLLGNVAECSWELRAVCVVLLLGTPNVQNSGVFKDMAGAPPFNPPKEGSNISLYWVMRKWFINREASIKACPRSQRASLGVSRMGLGPHLFLGSCSSQHRTPELPRGSCSWLIPPKIQPPTFTHPVFLPTPTWHTQPPLPAKPWLTSFSVNSRLFLWFQPIHYTSLWHTHLPNEVYVPQGLRKEWQHRYNSEGCSAPLTVSPDSEVTHSTEQNGFLKGALSPHLLSY